MSTDIAQTIASSHLFSSLNETEHAYLTQHATLKTFAEEQTIVQEGEKVHALYLITRGVARVSTTSMDREIELKKLGAGSYFGEVSVLSGKTATATVKAYSSDGVETVAIGREAILELLQNKPDLRKVLEGVTLARAKDTISKVLK